MYAASTAPEITCTAAVRMPAKITGSASGISTLRRISLRVMPIPRAASTTSGSTCRTAVYVLIRIGGSASSVSAKSDGTKPVPITGITSASTASDGSVRPILAVADRELRGALRAREQDSGRNCNRDRDRERRRRQRDVRPQCAEEALRVRDDELPGFDEQHSIGGATAQPALEMRECRSRRRRRARTRSTRRPRSWARDRSRCR